LIERKPMKERKRTSPAGMRGIATLQTVVRNAKPQERYQLASRFARLENERARLEREIGIWYGCQRIAEGKLAKIRAEVDALRPLLEETPAYKAICRSGRGQHRGPALEDAPGPQRRERRSVQLEY
jgi:hypothetical protein